MTDSKVAVRIPVPYRCAVALTYDFEMCAGYAPPGKNCHGRAAPFLAEYTGRLMQTAEQFDAPLHFFAVANGIEDGCDLSVQREALKRGHAVDSHTYSHLNLAETPPDQLDADLKLANKLLKAKLGIDPVVIRGPGGYLAGALGPASRKVILANGFRYVSGQYNGANYYTDLDESARDSELNPPHRYPEGLIELPFHGQTDRGFFDMLACVNPAAYEQWRAQFGHQPVPPNWRCPWTAPDALDRWIRLLKKCADYAYEHRQLYVFVSHPYSHYLHDPQNTVLPALLTHLRAKAEPVWTGTLRDVIRELIV